MKKIKLFCLPYAGGSAQVFYNNFKLKINKNIEIVPVELSGRGSRICDTLFDNIDEVIKDIYNKIEKDLDCDYAIFGYSLGGILAFELAHLLLSKNIKSPKNIFFSAVKSPRSKFGEKEIHLYSEEKLIDHILSYNATPKEIFENEELRNMILPVIRNDYKLIENYNFNENREKFNFPITVFKGIDDDFSDEEIKNWELETKNDCEILGFTGGHFFINEFNNFENVIRIIEEKLLG